MNNYADFNTDKTFAEKCGSAWMKYYESKEFLNKIQSLSKRGKIKIVKIDRSENPLFQAETYLDAIIVLSNGSSLAIDEKCLRYKETSNLDEGIVELWSNPNKDGKHNGWGYHRGIVIVQSYFDPITYEMKREPSVFRIDEKFVNEVTRNDIYTVKVNRPTNGFYRSGYKWIPRKVLEAYWP